MLPAKTTVPLDALRAAVRSFELDGGCGPQPNLILMIAEDGKLTIKPEAPDPIEIPPVKRRSN